MAIFSTPPSNLKHRVFTCLTKLSDRDTYSVACSELESIARNLEPSSFQAFLSCIHSTDASDKSTVRKQCVRLLAILSETHGNALSPHISKMISNIIRRLRDPDSSVRSACVGSVTALASHVTKPPFSIFLKAFADALFTEQDVNSQIGAALCLASAIDAAPDPEPVKLGKLLPKLEKLLKCDSYKARPALLTLLGSVIARGGASSCEASKNLVPSLVGFLANEDWATRKSAAEALAKLAVSEREFLSEFKSDCMKTFENRRFDKVKLVREAMGQMLEAWKQIPDISGDVSSPSLPLSPSILEKDDNGCYPAGSKNISIAAVKSSQPRRKIIPSSRSSPPDNSLATTARKRSPLGCKDKLISPASVRKPDRRKLQEWKVEISVSKAPTSRGTVEAELKGRNENVQDKKTAEKMKISKPETKRALFSKNSDDKMHKFGGFRSGSRVAPLHDESPESAVVVSNVTGDQHRNTKDTEELLSIRTQLAQIEKQQSNLMDLLQRFIGSSQNGMQSLETRVHGLELALDEISYDLALSNGRITGTDSWRSSCCMLPGAKFLTSKFRKKTDDGRLLTSRTSTSGATPMSGMSYRAKRLSNSESPSRRFRLQGSGGFIVNPLAEIQGQSRGVSDPANHNH